MNFVLFYGNSEIYSNFYPASFEIDGKTFPTSEHYFMYVKAMTFDPDGEVTYERLVNAPPNEAKKLGRQVRFYSESRWNGMCKDVMYRACLAKFSQNPDLKQQMLETGDAIIVECSPRDRKWGIGMGKNNPNATSPSKWRGQNLLGEVLMRVRKTLQEGMTDEEIKEYLDNSAVNSKVAASKPVDKTAPPKPALPLPDIKVGDKIFHKAFKDGVVKELENGKMIVTFDIGEKQFIFPNAVNDGFIEIAR